MLIDAAPAPAQERPDLHDDDLSVPILKDVDASATLVTEYFTPTPGRHLAQMLLVTTLVAGLPLVVSLTLRACGLLTSGWLSVGLAVVLSVGASSAGSAYWRRRDRTGEVLFSELLLWGWIRRWRQERELANATRLLDLVNPAASGTGKTASGTGKTASGTGKAASRTEESASGTDETLTVERREQLLRQLAGALEGQDLYLNGHSRRVARHATMIARHLGLPSEDVARIRAAAAVHDVGKLLTPKAVLNKPGRLSEAEFEVIKRHPVDGAEMVAALGDPELTRIVRHHHERLDGGGYPDGLVGTEIPLGARIIAVADTFDAITSARPYREAAPHQAAIDILRQEAGTQLDPDAVRTFLAYYSGNRPAVVWAILCASLRRVAAWLTGDPAAAATISASKVAAATAATAAIGAAAAAPVPVIVHHARPTARVARVQRPAPTAGTAATRASGARAASTTVAATSVQTTATKAAAHRAVRSGVGHVPAAGRHLHRVAASHIRRGAGGSSAAWGGLPVAGPSQSQAKPAQGNGAPVPATTNPSQPSTTPNQPTTTPNQPSTSSSSTVAHAPTTPTSTPPSPAPRSWPTAPAPHPAHHTYSPPAPQPQPIQVPPVPSPPQHVSQNPSGNSGSQGRGADNGGSQGRGADNGGSARNPAPAVSPPPPVVSAPPPRPQVIPSGPGNQGSPDDGPGSSPGNGNGNGDAHGHGGH